MRKASKYYFFRERQIYVFVIGIHKKPPLCTRCCNTCTDIIEERKSKNNSNENETQEYSRNSKEKGATQLMNINIYIMRGNETLSWEDLNAKEKQEIGSALNQQALTSIGYKPEKEERR